GSSILRLTRKLRADLNLDLAGHIERAGAREDRARAVERADEVAAARAHLARLHGLLVQTLCPERRQRAMRRARHRVLRHALVGGEEARDEVVTRIAGR